MNLFKRVLCLLYREKPCFAMNFSRIEKLIIALYKNFGC